MRTALALLLLLVPVLPRAADTYTWVDENNERHWSDTPHEGAEKVELTPQNIYRPLARQPAPGAARPAPSAAAAATQCRITQPLEDQVLFDIDSLTISVSVTYAPNGIVSATLDGAALAPTQPGGSSFRVSPIDRGTHVAAAVVRDAAGRTLCTAPPVTFHVRQHSVARPP
jgi:hypothetical protein